MHARRGSVCSHLEHRRKNANYPSDLFDVILGQIHVRRIAGQAQKHPIVASRHGSIDGRQFLPLMLIEQLHRDQFRQSRPVLPRGLSQFT